jgi:hypothetical protein
VGSEAGNGRSELGRRKSKVGNGRDVGRMRTEEDGWRRKVG